MTNVGSEQREGVAGAGPTGEDYRIVMIDGEIVPLERAAISVFDRGFLYGDSVYEVLRTYERVPFALREHLERLQRSAERVFIDLPVSLDQLADEVRRALDDATGPRSWVRIHVTRGSGPIGLDPLPARNPTRVILVTRLNPPTPAQYEGGIGVALVRTQRTLDNTDAVGAKVANYLVSLLAVRQAVEIGAVEAIIVDGLGRVLEGASSNVFLVKNGELLTPPVTEGILPGITRQWLFRAADSLKIPVREQTISVEDLRAADEVFISSTTREVLPVVRADGEKVADGRVGRLTRAIHHRFRDLGNLPPLPTTLE